MNEAHVMLVLSDPKMAKQIEHLAYIAGEFETQGGERIPKSICLGVDVSRSALQGTLVATDGELLCIRYCEAVVVDRVEGETSAGEPRDPGGLTDGTMISAPALLDCDDDLQRIIDSGVEYTQIEVTSDDVDVVIDEGCTYYRKATKQYPYWSNYIPTRDSVAIIELVSAKQLLAVLAARVEAQGDEVDDKLMLSYEEGKIAVRNESDGEQIGALGTVGLYPEIVLPPFVHILSLMWALEFLLQDDVGSIVVEQYGKASEDRLGLLAYESGVAGRARMLVQIAGSEDPLGLI